MNKLRSSLFLILIFLILTVVLLNFLLAPKSLFAPTFTSRIAIHFPQLVPKTATVIAVGDIMLGRYVNIKMQEHEDWRYPFLKTSSLTSSANITFGNLEAPFIEGCRNAETGMIFCARKEAIQGLKSAGFDVLSIANNHILNQGQGGLKQTIELLNQNGITPSTNQLTNKLNFGFLSFDLVTYPKTPVVEEVEENAGEADILIVSLHWGAEYAKEPTEAQKKLAHQIIDAGAKVIVGHHPHVTQPTEKYHDGLIFYSLGNFVFDQPWSEETKKGKIAKIVFEGKKIKSFEEIPIYIEDYSQPKIVQ